LSFEIFSSVVSDNQWGQFFEDLLKFLSKDTPVEMSLPHDHNVAKVTPFEVGLIGGFPETVAANRVKLKKELVNIEWHAKDGHLISRYKLHRLTFCCDDL
jgi:hypothetical protein